MSGADSYAYNNLILPRESKDFLGNMENKLDINLYLLQNRFCYEKPDNSKKRDSKKPEGEIEQTKKYGSLLSKEICNKGINYTAIYEKEAVRLIKRLNDQNKKITGNFVCPRLYKFKPYDKLIIGESSSECQDTEPLKLHPLFGIPYIPASVIKGTLRGVWVMEQYGGNVEKAEADDDFIALFDGKRKDGKSFEGKLVFFDIFPEKFTIKLDIQTLHHEKYYNKSYRQPTDDQTAIPIRFACLKDSVFPVFIASGDKDVRNHWHNDIDDMVRCMFTQYGIGAKTALGYGVGSVELDVVG